MNGLFGGSTDGSLAEFRQRPNFVDKAQRDGVVRIFFYLPGPHTDGSPSSEEFGTNFVRPVRKLVGVDSGDVDRVADRAGGLLESGPLSAGSLPIDHRRIGQPTCLHGIYQQPAHLADPEFCQEVSGQIDTRLVRRDYLSVRRSRFFGQQFFDDRAVCCHIQPSPAD